MNDPALIPSTTYCTLIIEDGDRVLFSVLSGDTSAETYDLVKGTLQLGETPVSAAHRIAETQIGMPVVLTAIAGIYYLTWGDEKGVSIYFNFYARLKKSTSIDQELASSAAKYKWSLLQELKHMLDLGENGMSYFASPSVTRIVQDVLAGERYPLKLLFTEA